MKLLSYDFVIQYKKGEENVVADVLSRKEEIEGKAESLLTMISFPNPEWLEELKNSYEQSLELTIVIFSLSQGRNCKKGYRLQHGLLLKKRKDCDEF